MLTLLLIAVTTVLSWQALSNPRLLDRLILWPPAIDRQRQYERLLTHGFIHADWPHLIFNMVTLFFFGRPIERVFAAYAGGAGFLLFYLSAVVVAILPSYRKHLHDARYRSLGASGAVSAVLFAFILLQPWTTIYVTVVPVPAVVYAAGYIAYSVWAEKQGVDNVNHSAHLTGAAYGVLVMLLLDPRVLQDFIGRLAHPTLG